MSATGPTTDHKEIRRWAERHKAVPTELLPHVLDSEPALLRFVLAEQVRDHADLRMLT